MGPPTVSVLGILLLFKVGDEVKNVTKDKPMRKFRKLFGATLVLPPSKHADNSRWYRHQMLFPKGNSHGWNGNSNENKLFASKRGHRCSAKIIAV
jgi:hypothetical protein